MKTNFYFCFSASLWRPKWFYEGLTIIIGVKKKLGKNKRFK